MTRPDDLPGEQANSVEASSLPGAPDGTGSARLARLDDPERDEPDAGAPSRDRGASLRPVDWDGSSSRVWDARRGNDVTNQLAAEADERWSEEILQQLREEQQEAEREECDDRD
ncbi:hypothetical protein MXD61_17520 [Frankia sp. AgPm24]|uniref:hypothetical protein n=1 Tax=Frankia sp. AgPm24 TaxID=631128 RepID=UPI0020106908|nr:hypothetical protein [Frankia sp. AgPm24]MCK9923646.1 hypothetical protein [Frankia sp. AgPm24]